MVRNTMVNPHNRKRESMGSIQSPNEPYSGTTGVHTVADNRDIHKASIESGMTY
jgi:hypothetical protein